jgi:hypothetical protein
MSQLIHESMRARLNARVLIRVNKHNEGNPLFLTIRARI